MDAGHRCWPGPECVGTRTCWWRIGRAVPVRRVSRLRSGNAQGAQAGIAPFLRGNAVFCGPVVEHHRGRKTVFYRGPNSPRWLWITPGAPRRETTCVKRVGGSQVPPTALASPTASAAPAPVAVGHRHAAGRGEQQKAVAEQAAQLRRGLQHHRHRHRRQHRQHYMSEVVGCRVDQRLVSRLSRVTGVTLLQFRRSADLAFFCAGQMVASEILRRPESKQARRRGNTTVSSLAGRSVDPCPPVATALDGSPDTGLARLPSPP